jgi:hypothetical protein
MELLAPCQETISMVIEMTLVDFGKQKARPQSQALCFSCRQAQQKTQAA